MIPMCAAKWLAAAAVATLSAWLCLLARSHGIHPLRRILDFPGIRSKVGIVLLLPFLSATIVHGSEKLRDLINILLPSNRADNASSSAGLRTDEGANGTNAIWITAFAVHSNAVEIAASIDGSAIDVGDTLFVKHKYHALTNDWVEGDFGYVPPETTNFTFVVARTNDADAAFYRVSQGLRVVAPALPYAVRANGSRLYVATTNQFSVSTTGGTQGGVEPGDAPPEDPLGSQPNHEYDPTNGVVTVEADGQYLLPNGDAVLRLTPTVSFGEPHNYRGTTLRAVSSGLRSGEPDYVPESSYPLDSQCLWEAWHEGTNEVGWSCCSCEPKIDCGVDISRYDFLAASCDVSNETAYASLSLNGTNIWTGCAVHERWSESGGTSDHLSADPCGGCGACDSGSCDALDGPSVGSVRFRIALGIPDERHVTGFLWFDRDGPFTPTPSSLSLLARNDANVTDTTSYGIRTVSSSDRGGRTIVVSNITDGVRLAATFTASGANDRSWEITRSGNAMRFRKFTAGGNLMSDVSYALADGVWSVVDNDTGLVETTTTFSDPYGGDWKETVRSCGAVTASAVRVKSEMLDWGWGADPVLRETERMELTSFGWLHSHATYHTDWESRRNGCLRMEWGDDRPWAWHAYDDHGRETFRLDQRNGSEPPVDYDDYSIDCLPYETDAFATVLEYAPHPGDSCDTNDCDKVRTESRYVVSGGPQSSAAVLIARTWTRYSRGVAANGWPTVTETTIRAFSQDTTIDDPMNEISVRTTYSSDSASVPYLLRGAVVSETDADGVTETHEYTIADGVVSETSRKSYNSHSFPTVAYTERDLAYGNTLYESTRLAADETVEFDWRRMTYDSRNRLRRTEYSDGSSETNDYSCCQLRFRIDRTGAKTLFTPTNRIDRLYHAEEEVSLCQLPHDERYIPYEAGTGGTLDRAHRCVQHFADAFGRETNTMTRVCVNNGASADPHYSQTYGWRSPELTDYPNGHDDVSVSIDARGLVTHRARTASSSCETSTNLVFVSVSTAIPAKTAITTSIRGGDTILEEMADGKWRRERTLRDYGTAGCATVTSVTESSDSGLVTNSVVHYDFLGRVAQTWTPLSCVTNDYDGTSSRIDVYRDTVSGIATTNIIDDCGDEIGSTRLGVSNISRTDYEVVSGVCWRVETQATFAGSATNAITITRTRLTGFSDSVRSEIEERANGVLVSHATSAFDANALILVETNESVIAGLSVTKSKFGRVIEEYSSGATIWNYFDPYGRVFYRERDIGDGQQRKVDWTGYDNAGDVEEYDEGWYKFKDDFFEEYYSRDAFGNCISTLDHMTNATTRSYDAEGRVVSEGGATYPLQKGYDTSGRMTSLRTTRDGTVWDETQWSYDPVTGLCVAKTYSDGTVVTNSYTQDGLLVRKETVGGHWSERAYDSARRVSAISYSDGTSESFEYDVFGNETSASNAVAAYAYSRDARGLATNETASTIGGMFSVYRGYDEYGRLVSVGTGSGCGPDSFSYDACGSIAVMSNAEAAVVYAYTPDGLDAGYVVTLSNGVSFTRSIIRDAYRRGLVTCITNAVSFPSDGSIEPDASYYANSSDGGLTNVFIYSYDSLSRPVSRNGHAFQYNSRSEVTRDGLGNWLYGYDDIGNWGDYTANELNQYVGTSYDPFGANVDEYSTDGEMLAYYTSRYVYDAKSRIVSVGYWTHDYDENYAAGNPQWYYVEAVSNGYDHLDRRVQKITPEATHSFFYDGWMLVKEVVANTNGTIDVIEYHWGNDLSGTRGGAAGVGGLLYISVTHSSTPHSSTPNSSTHQLYIPWYDSNGNVMGYWDERGKVAASFDYGAFGETYTYGDNPNAFPIRFSTKYHDVESDLYYYTKRFYIPSLHRWLTRDPIEEEGGVNLYAMCGNNTVNEHDHLGLTWKILRNGNKFAFAVADAESDSFRDLARIIELDISDYTKWAHTKDSSPIRCKKYLIPNQKIYHKGVRSFYENWSNNIIGNWDSKNEKQMLTDRKNGFQVVLRNTINDNDIMSDLGSDGLYEYTFTGHGEQGSIAAANKDFPFGPKRITIYGIHKITVQACDSFNDMSRQKNVLAPGWAANVATVGTFIGYVGKVRLLFRPESQKRSRHGTNSSDIIILKGTNR